MKPLVSIDAPARGIFRERPNRFLAVVDIIEPEPVHGARVHVHDPGRLKELLYPGNELLLRPASSPGRKTGWDVIAARHGRSWVLVHAGFHRAIASAILSEPGLSPLGPCTDIRAEVRRGQSRFDFTARDSSGSETWIEVKGCSLAVDGVALFPDAPTERGRRHVEELIAIREEGRRAVVLVLVFRPDALCWAPKADTDPAFAETVARAAAAGVEFYPVLTPYRRGGIFFERQLDLCLERGSPG